MIRRFLLSTGVAALGVGALAPAVAAVEEWCATDPAVPIRTPAGSTVVVHVTNSALGTQHEAALRDAAITTSVKRARGSGTDVEIHVTVPDDRFASGYPTRAVVSTRPWGAGTVLATAAGKSGRVMKLRFHLDTP